MRWTSIAQPHVFARAGILSWLLTTLLLVAVSLDPYAATQSPLQLHGALQRAGAAEVAPSVGNGHAASPAASGSAEPDRTRLGIISHRGAAAIAPENTLAAFRAAIAQGVDFVETDVQLTSDGVPMLMHDPTLDRTTNGSGPIAERSFEQVRALDAGSWFGAGFIGERVPTLEEFIELLRPAPTRAFIELKGEWDADQVASVMQLLRDRQLVNRVVLESFEIANLEMVQEVAPEFARMLLTRELNDEVLGIAVELQASAIGAREGLFAEDPGFVADIRRAGMGAVVYTLNSDEQWWAAAEMGMDFVITDDPVALDAWRSQEAA